ncbi:hypothetical protein TKK_0017503 [Trichogramma kaykai]
MIANTSSEFRAHMQQVKPVLTTLHSETQPFVYKDLNSCSHLFLRSPPIKKALDPPYIGPFKIYARPSPHFFVIKMTNKQGLEELKTVSTLRVKPAFGTFDDLNLLVRENNPYDDTVDQEDIECDYTQNVPENFVESEPTDTSVKKSSVPKALPKINKKPSTKTKQVKFHLEHSYDKKADSAKTKTKTRSKNTTKKDDT